jgi:RNA polymerase sigma-70 factor, ECF subfamily
VLLKDVFDYTLEEIAELIDSTVGGVKAALNRGRSKLTDAETALRSAPRPAAPSTTRAKSEGETRLLHLYVERFNQRDWDGLRTLIAADARLRVADRFDGRMIDSPYFHNYERTSSQWRLTVGDVEGESAVIVFHHGADGWTPARVVRLDVTDGHITRITDYWHCPWILPAAISLSSPQPAERTLS